MVFSSIFNAGVALSQNKALIDGIEAAIKFIKDQNPAPAVPAVTDYKDAERLRSEAEALKEQAIQIQSQTVLSLVNLKSEFEAIMEKQQRNAFRAGLVVNVIFFALGIAASAILGL